MTSIWRIVTLGGVLVLALAALACSSDDNNDTNQSGGAESQLCTDLDDLDTALQGVAKLNSSSTVDDAKQARTNVQTAMDDVVNSAKQSASGKTDNLNNAVNALQQTLSGVSGSQTLGSVTSQIGDEVANVAIARQELGQEASCPK